MIQGIGGGAGLHRGAVKVISVEMTVIRAKWYASAEIEFPILNRLTGIWEIEGYGILVGVGIIEGYQYTGDYFTYLDVITPDRGIVQRIQIPGGLEVRDVWIGDGEVRLLTMLFDNINPLHFAIYSAPLESLFRH